MKSNERRCLLFATVDLPREYRVRLAAGETPPHWKTLLGHQAVDGIRVNATKSWHKDDLCAVIQAAHAARKLVMVDVVSKLRMRSRNGLNVLFRPGSVLRVATDQTAKDAPYTFSLPLDLKLVQRGQPVVIRDRRVLAHVEAVNVDAHTLDLAVDWQDAPELNLLEPPVNLPGSAGVGWGKNPGDAQVISMVCELGADLIALSFTEEPDLAKKSCEQIACSVAQIWRRPPQVILKIETARGVENIETILDALRPCGIPLAVEVARGDLENEVDLELPRAQEHVCHCARARGVPFGIATGLLASMRQSPFSSRAEKVDVWNSLRAGASFLVLTDETANDARHPAEAIDTLAQLRDLARRATSLFLPQFPT